MSDYSDDEIGVKYDNDGYPDLPREPTVIRPRTQHEALRYAARILAAERPGHPAIAALRAAAAALRTLAQENERLNQGWKDTNDQALDRGLEAAERIRKLEAERDAIPEEPTEVMLVAARDWSAKKYGKPIGNDAAIGCWKAMFAAIRALAQTEGRTATAIRAKTIEECAKIGDGWLERFGDGDIKYTSATKYASDAVKDIAEAIRALAHASTSAQQDESKTES